jgi:hypothetical protein
LTQGERSIPAKRKERWEREVKADNPLGRCKKEWMEAKIKKMKN